MNYPIREKELLAVIAAMKKWRHYLLGTKVTVFTDHESLKYLKTQKNLSPRLMRWQETLAEFDIQWEYSPGTQNRAADALSRMYLDLDAISELTDSEYDELLYDESDEVLWPVWQYFTSEEPTDTQLASPKVRQLLRHVEKRDNKLWWLTEGKEPRLVIPSANTELRLKLLKEAHDSPSGGHFGFWKTYKKLSRRMYWPGMSKDIRRYTKNCEAYQRNKGSTTRALGGMVPLEIPADRWSSISMDFVTGLPEAEGHDAILTIVDRLTKRVLLIPTTTTATAKDTAELLISHLYRTFGLPDSIVSDRDPKFVSKLWEHFMNALGTQLKRSTAYHPQTDGQTERTNRVLEECLRSYVATDEDSWVRSLPLVEFAINSSEHSSTGMTPFYADLGLEPRTPMDISLPTTASPVAEELKEHMTAVIRKIRDSLFDVQQRMINRDSRNLKPEEPIHPGQYVYVKRVALLTEQERHKHRKNKLQARWVGPFEVTEAIGTNAYRLQLPPTMRAHNVVNISYLKLAYQSTEFGRDIRPEPEMIPSSDGYEYEEFEVERVLKTRQRNGKTEYLIRWKGWSPDDDTWEPIEHLSNARRHIEEYESQSH